MSYQAVIRNISNELVTNQEVGMQISILQGSADGATVYMETRLPSTNENGLVSIDIGGEDATVISGDFSAIDWSDGPYFIKTETDPSGGTTYTITGTSQLLSVPYALHAKTAETILEPIVESDPVFEASPAAGIEAGDIRKWDESYSWGDHSGEGYATKDMAGEKIINIGEPENLQDAATKAYVDNILIELGILPENYSGIISDVDGNTYRTVKIGEQIWMAENLRTTRYADGTLIELDISDWIYIPEYIKNYGKLYTWEAVMNGLPSSNNNPSGVQGVCPAGWHVPSDAEWAQLIDYLFDEHGIPNTDVVNGAGNALKAARQVDHPWGGSYATERHPRWSSHDAHYGTDEFGFSALPGGRSDYGGAHIYLGEMGWWWSSTEKYLNYAWCPQIHIYYGKLVFEMLYKVGGASVRCVRNTD